MASARPLARWRPLALVGDGEAERSGATAPASLCMRLQPQLPRLKSSEPELGGWWGGEESVKWDDGLSEPPVLISGAVVASARGFVKR